MGTVSYPPLRLAFPNREDWIFSEVLAHQARARPGCPFLQFMEEPAWSYGEVDLSVNRLAHGLLRLGVQRGDRVLIMLPNSIEYMLTWWAANRIGAIEVSVNNAYKGYFLEHLVNNSGGKIMVVVREFLDRLAASEEKLPHLETLIVYDRERRAPADVPTFKRFRVMEFEELFTSREHPPGIPLSHATSAPSCTPPAPPAPPKAS